jgi:hypothetical protein
MVRPRETDEWLDSMVDLTDDRGVEWSMIFGIADIQEMFCIVAT